MRTLHYQLCDVFTDRPLAGNALAVFTDAHGLSTATLQALARELNLSECAFVVQHDPSDPASSGVASTHDARIRIFTPTMELPFAGHPTLGAAFVLTAGRQAPRIRLATARGVSVVTFSRSAGAVAFGTMTQPLPRISAYEPQAELLSALGVREAVSPIELYDNGPHYVLVELSSPAQLAALRPDMARLEALGSIAATVFAPDGSRWKSRVFAPGEGIAEDPGTGAAAGPVAVHLCRRGRIAYGTQILIDQGVEIGRPSTLHARASGNDAALESVEVGGRAVVIGRGEIDLPDELLTLA
jgi:trans-2,3-dihydro-3-hydroxyanthranilate isomerase